nr:probable 6-phosphogluconolactonase 4, chloroplastic [Tanacetum cinerariifolium]
MVRKRKKQPKRTKTSENGRKHWSKWLIFFLDERVVPLDGSDSNFKLAYDGFLSKEEMQPMRSKWLWESMLTIIILCLRKRLHLKELSHGSWIRKLLQNYVKLLRFINR